jgi:perosamine synthetase
VHIPGVQAPYVASTTTRMSWFVYVVRFHPEIDRDRAARILKQRGIPARPYFLPIHLQPYMATRFGYHEGDFPVTEDLGRRGLALPFSSVMTEQQVELVYQALQEAAA